MIVECKSCHTRFKIGDDKVTARGVKVRCSRCKFTFLIRPGDDVARATDGAASTGPTFGVEATKVDHNAPPAAQPAQTMQMFKVSPADIRTAQRAATFDLDATDGAASARSEQADPFYSPLTGGDEEMQFSGVDVPPTTPLSTLASNRGSAAASLFSSESDATMPMASMPRPPRPSAADPASGWSDVTARAKLSGGATQPFARQPVADPFVSNPVTDPFASHPVIDPFAAIAAGQGVAQQASQVPWAMQSTDPTTAKPATAFNTQPSLEIDIDVESPFDGVPHSGPVIDPFATRAATGGPPPLPPPGADAGVDPLAPPAGAGSSVSADDLFSGLGIPSEHDFAPPPMADSASALAEAGGFDQVGGEQQTRLRTVDEGVLKLLAEYDAQEKATVGTPAAASAATLAPPSPRKAIWWHLVQTVAGLVVIAALLVAIYQFRGGVISELTPSTLLHVVLSGPQSFSADSLVTQHVAVSYYPVTASQRQVVVLGEVRNGGATALPGVLVKGHLVDADKQLIATEEVYAGALLTPLDLAPSATSQHLAQLVAARAVATAKPLAPGAAWPFALVFTRIPEGAQGGRVQVEARAADAPRVGGVSAPESAPHAAVPLPPPAPSKAKWSASRPAPGSRAVPPPPPPPPPPPNP